MPNNPYYVFDANLCKAESLTREQIINAIAQATGVTPTDVDEGFISTILESNHNRNINIWKGSRAEYNALESKSLNTLYIIDDDTTISDYEAHLDAVDEAISELNDAVDALEEETKIPTGGSAGQVLTKKSDGVEWDDVPTELPSGGSNGDVLIKSSSGTAWQTPSSKKYLHNVSVTILNAASNPMLHANFSFPTVSSTPLSSLADVASAFNLIGWSGSFSIPCTGAYNSGTYKQICAIEDSGLTYAFVAYVASGAELSRDAVANFNGTFFSVSVSDTVIDL